MLDEFNVKLNMFMLDSNNSHHHAFFEIEFNRMGSAIDTFDSKPIFDMKSSISIDPNKLVCI